MFGLGFWEIVLIVLAVIVFVRPRELPKFFFRVGRVYGQLLEFNRNARDMIRRLEREIEEAPQQDAGNDSAGQESGERQRSDPEEPQ